MALQIHNGRVIHSDPPAEISQATLEKMRSNPLAALAIRRAEETMRHIPVLTEQEARAQFPHLFPEEELDAEEMDAWEQDLEAWENGTLSADELLARH